MMSPLACGLSYWGGQEKRAAHNIYTPQTAREQQEDEIFRLEFILMPPDTDCVQPSDSGAC